MGCWMTEEDTKVVPLVDLAFETKLSGGGSFHPGPLDVGGFLAREGGDPAPPRV